MQTPKHLVKYSKFLSLVLRHKPHQIGIELDAQGWTDVAALIAAANHYGLPLDWDTLREVVAHNDKQRFALDEAAGRIRAKQGHSVPIELGYQPQPPPEVLYHGTAEKNVASIRATGLQRGRRHHVHLSPDIPTALKVGGRHGKPFIFEVLAGQMAANGFTFFCSDNGVWLTEQVPAEYLHEVDAREYGRHTAA